MPGLGVDGRPVGQLNADVFDLLTFETDAERRIGEELTGSWGTRPAVQLPHR